jgi:hypothetical protein
MARRINHDKGVICAEADPDDDDVTFAFDKIKKVSSKAVLLKADGDEHWIPFSQIVDLFPKNGEAIITKWIAEQKGLG